MSGDVDNFVEEVDTHKVKTVKSVRLDDACEKSSGERNKSTKTLLGLYEGMAARIHSDKRSETFPGKHIKDNTNSSVV